MLQDVRYAARVMMKARGLTIVAIVTLGLGIGANTAIFSVINALLLRPLPYPDADRLVMVWQDMRARGGPATEWTTPANHFDWSAQQDVFESVTTFRGWNASLAGNGLPEAVVGEQVTPEYFDVLGGRALLGRTFRQDDGLPNAPRVVVLASQLWTERFGGDRSIIGRVVSINGEPHEIVGVLAPGFRPALATDARIWRPQQLDAQRASRNAVVFHTIGKLKAGVPLEQARAKLATLAARLQRDYPQSNTDVGINPVPLQEQQVGAMRPALFMLFGAVGFVLLIACVNIANLLLSRASGRLREMAVRRALGADRLRIIRQLLTESLLLALAGGTLGVAGSVWGVSALRSMAPAGTPRIEEVGVDGVVLGFALVLSLGTGLLFGLVPAWHAAKDRFTSALKQGGRGQAGDGSGRARQALIVAELALALMLLVGGGLLVRTFLALQRADLGFNPDHVLSGFVLPPRTTYETPDQRRAFYDAVLARTSALPGVRQAALSSVVPLGGDSDTTIEIEGRPKAETNADALVVWYRVVSANYFNLMEIPLRRGRLFAAGEAAPAVVINEMTAKKYWPGEDPIGRRLRADPDGPWFTVIGVVGDVQVRGARGTSEVEAYLPVLAEPRGRRQCRAEDRDRSRGDDRTAAPRDQGHRPGHRGLRDRHHGGRHQRRQRRRAFLCDPRGDLRGAGAGAGRGRRVRRDVVRGLAADAGDRSAAGARRERGPDLRARGRQQPEARAVRPRGGRRRRHRGRPRAAASALRRPELGSGHLRPNGRAARRGRRPGELPPGPPGHADRPDGSAEGRIRTVHQIDPSNQ